VPADERGGLLGFGILQGSATFRGI
jgi:hypothetical protein